MHRTNRMKRNIAFPALLGMLVILSGCKNPRAVQKEGQLTSPAAQTDQAAPTALNQPAGVAEIVPSGDIPDSQVFITYTSAAGGYALQVPEGWGRTEEKDEVRFTDKFDAVRIRILKTNDEFSLQNIKEKQIPTLEKTELNVGVTGIVEKTLKGGASLIVSYDSDSEPDSVTAKRIRLENKSYYFHRPGVLAIVTVCAPRGSDNVDQWDLISNSFNWN